MNLKHYGCSLVISKSLTNDLNKSKGMFASIRIFSTIVTKLNIFINDLIKSTKVYQIQKLEMTTG